MKFDIYSLWIDPMFYISIAVLAVFLFLLVYSIRKYMEISNAAEDDDMEDISSAEGMGDRGQGTSDREQEPKMQNFIKEDPFEKTVIAQASDMPEDIADNENFENMPKQSSVGEDLSKAEDFVKGIFNGISDIDERLKAVESTLSERKLNGDFALRYLEDILDEFDSMDKTAVKSRIEYLIADLKK